MTDVNLEEALQKIFGTTEIPGKEVFPEKSVKGTIREIEHPLYKDAFNSMVRCAPDGKIVFRSDHLKTRSKADDLTTNLVSYDLLSGKTKVILHDEVRLPSALTDVLGERRENVLNRYGAFTDYAFLTPETIVAVSVRLPRDIDRWAQVEMYNNDFPWTPQRAFLDLYQGEHRRSFDLTALFYEYGAKGIWFNMATCNVENQQNPNSNPLHDPSQPAVTELPGLSINHICSFRVGNGMIVIGTERLTCPSSYLYQIITLDSTAPQGFTYRSSDEYPKHAAIPERSGLTPLYPLEEGVPWVMERGERRAVFAITGKDESRQRYMVTPTTEFKGAEALNVPREEGENRGNKIWRRSEWPELTAVSEHVSLLSLAGRVYEVKLMD